MTTRPDVLAVMRRAVTAAADMDNVMRRIQDVMRAPHAAPTSPDDQSETEESAHG